MLKIIHLYSVIRRSIHKQCLIFIQAITILVFNTSVLHANSHEAQLLEPTKSISEIYDILSLTPTGKKLLGRLLPLVDSGAISIDTSETADHFIRLKEAGAVFIHRLYSESIRQESKTIYVNLSERPLFWSAVEMVHEITHALDANLHRCNYFLFTATSLSDEIYEEIKQAKTFHSEKRAYIAQLKFFEELAKLVPSSSNLVKEPWPVPFPTDDTEIVSAYNLSMSSILSSLDIPIFCR